MDTDSLKNALLGWTKKGLDPSELTATEVATISQAAQARGGITYAGAGVQMSGAIGCLHAPPTYPTASLSPSSTPSYAERWRPERAIAFAEGWEACRREVAQYFTSQYFTQRIATLDPPIGGIGRVESAHQDEERTVADRVDQVCQDITAGKVVPRQVDQVAAAAHKAQTDQKVSRAIRAIRP
jgi:hypothetical protein